MDPLPLFPYGSLASSVITTVWLGVLVVALANLRLGWVLSGLVIPGYTVPLLLIKPWSAAVVFLEGIVTYLLVRFFSEQLSRLGYWSSLFGRDRFFALVLISVAVRLVFDGWLLRVLGETLNQAFNLQFDYRGQLHSFGLIIIALIANQFWKPGLRGGLIPMGVTVGVTYLIVRYGLMEFTNFSISSLSYMYEDLASSILASPKAYIILLTTAFIASRMNLHYGWDFNGILIPSLLALQWYQPIKILTSFVEAFIILGLARLLLQTPLCARVNMEGARKLLFFFNIGFAYKMLLGYVLPYLLPPVKVTDAYAFGYLLSTLIAIRMHDKNVVAQLTRATLQTSLVAVAIASLIGFFLTSVPTARLWQGVSVTRPEPPVIELPRQDLIALLRQDEVMLYESRTLERIPVPLPKEITAFSTAVQLLLAEEETPSPQALAKAAELLAGVNYRIHRVANRYFYLKEHPPLRGWGFYVLQPDSAHRLVVEVPAPLDEAGALEAGRQLFALLSARGIAIAGSRRRANPDGSSDVLLNQNTLFHAFHAVLARRDILQVRGYTPERRRVLAGVRSAPHRPVVPDTPTSLWVKTSLPPGLELPRLRELIGPLDIHWQETPFTNRQRQTTRSGFAELVINPAVVRSILARAFLAQAQGTVPLQVGEPRIDGYLQAWLLTDKAQLAGPGSNLYQPPRLEELLYLDEQVLIPLLRLINQEYRNETGWTPGGLEALRTLDVAASVTNYRLLRYRHRKSGQEYLLLTEDETTGSRRYWGTYVFRLGSSRPYMVAIPRPLLEINSFEYGVTLFERLQAKVLLIAGAHPRANLDGSADLVRPDNAPGVFNLINQVILREAGPAPLLTINSRAYGYREDTVTPSVDVLVALSSGVYQRQAVNPLTDQLLKTLASDGLDYRFVDGSAETAGYEIGHTPQSRYLSAALHKEICTLWLSPVARSGYRQQTENRLQEKQFQALAIATLQADLYRHLASRTFADTPTLPPSLQAALQRYILRRDIVTLRRLQQEWPDYGLQRLIDHDSQQAFLLISDPRNRLKRVVNLAPRQPDQQMTAHGPPSSEQVDRFIASSAGILTFNKTP